MRDSDSGMQWQCYSWRRRPDTRFQACQLILQMWSFVDSMPRLVLLQYSDSLPTNMSKILTEICNIFRVIDMTKHTWKPHSWNVIQRSRLRDETQGHVIPATSMGPVGKFMLRWKNACAKSICCGRRYKLLWVALLHDIRWCISVAHYDSQYIAEWYLRKLGI